MTHTTRPIHPECPALDSDDPCRCSWLWQFWDGTGCELDRLVEQAARLDARRRVRHDDSNPDLDEQENNGDSEDDLAGFWKESEFLKTLDR